MNNIGRIAAVSIIAFLGSLISPTAKAVTDQKMTNAAICQPYGPNTLDSELRYSQKGITNPGTTNESVMCPIISDGDHAWSSSAGASAYWYVYFQAGSIPGRVACTVFVSNAAMLNAAVYTFTSNPANSAAGVRSFSYLPLADITGLWGVGAPTIALCTITPQATLAGFFVTETVSTNLP